MSIDYKKLSIRDEPARKNRLKQLSSTNKSTSKINQKHTKIVRFLRIILPLIAIAIVGTLLSWSSLEKTMETIPDHSILPKTIGKNELIEPRFESEDDKKQPFIITAKRAFQSDKDQEIIFLEAPEAEITLNDGAWLAIESNHGAYKQNDERLLLEGLVKLFHDAGYQMETEKLKVNLKNKKAWSETKVSGQGPAGSLLADNGMTIDTETGIIIFKGPAKLILNRKIKGL
jgi:lipopolysaccharide export system protein LptC